MTYTRKKNVYIFAGHPLVWIAISTSISLFGYLQRPPILPVNATYVALMLLLILFCLFTAVTNKRKQLHWETGDKLILLLSISIILSSILSTLLYDFNFNLLSNEGLSIIWSLLLYYISRLTFRNKEDIYWIINILLFSLFIQFLASLYIYLFNPKIGISVNNIGYQFINEIRLTGMMLNPNNFATLPALATPLFITFFLVAENKVYKWWLFSGATLSFLVLILSFSRSAWIGVLTATLWITFLIKPKIPKIKVKTFSLSMVILWAFGYALISFSNILPSATLWQSIQQRAYSIDNEESSGGRFEIWKHAGAMIVEYPLGVGVGNNLEAFAKTKSTYKSRFYRPRNLHNSILTIIVQCGLIAGVAFSSLIISPLFFARHIPTMAKKERIVFYGLSASLLSFLIHSLFHVVYGHKILWVLLACSVSMQQYLKQTGSK